MTSEIEMAARCAGQGDYLFDDERKPARPQPGRRSRERVAHWRTRDSGLAMTDVAAMAFAAAGLVLLAVAMQGRMSGRSRRLRGRAAHALEDFGRMNARNL